MKEEKLRKLTKKLRKVIAKEVTREVARVLMRSHAKNAPRTIVEEVGGCGY